MLLGFMRYRCGHLQQMMWLKETRRKGRTAGSDWRGVGEFAGCRTAGVSANPSRPRGIQIKTDCAKESVRSRTLESYLLRRRRTHFEIHSFSSKANGHYRRTLH